MKIKKNMLMLLSVGVGVLLLVSTAVADSLTRSPYDQLKDAIKFTSRTMTEQVDNFTVKTTTALSDNGEVLMSESATIKTDLKEGKTENTTAKRFGDKAESLSFSYTDRERSIFYDSGSDTYYVNEYTMPTEYTKEMMHMSSPIDNPFDDESAADVEKIVDAFIGNLKNYVTVTTAEDGSKEFTGTLSGAQIPALVNAVVSFVSKQYFSSSYYYAQDYKQYSSNYIDYQEPATPLLPEIKGDVLVKSVEGSVSVNADGIIVGFMIKGVVSGKDADGNPHDIGLEANGAIEDIGSTVVAMPDLTGKKVEVSKMDPREETFEVLPAKFIGAYKNDIIVDTNDSIKKVGERVLVIEEINGNQISGRYFEVYDEDYADAPATTNEFTFTDQIANPYNAFAYEITYTGNDSVQRTANLYIDTFTYKINLWIEDGKNNPQFQDTTFTKVFD
jgi:hypothetical protein